MCDLIHFSISCQTCTAAGCCWPCEMLGSVIAGRKRTVLRRFGWEFFCKACANEFEADWTQDKPVMCPRCGTKFDTAWLLNAAGDLLGPWLSNRVQDGQGGNANGGP